MYIRRITTILLLSIFLITIAPAVSFANMFSQPFNEEGFADYLGAASTVDSNGALVLDNRVSKIATDPKYAGNIEVVITKDNMASATVHVNEQGLQALKELSRKIYETNKIRNKINHMGQSVSIEADTERASVMLSGLQPLLSLLVGILAILVVLGMTLYTALDIVYITMPMFRNRVEEMKQTGNSVMTKETKTGEVKLRWISDEAQYAVMTSTIDSGKNPLTTYLTKRIWAYIMVAIVIYILLTGNIYLIVNIAINFISGILEVLAELGK